MSFNILCGPPSNKMNRRMVVIAAEISEEEPEKCDSSGFS